MYALRASTRWTFVVALLLLCAVSVGRAEDTAFPLREPTHQPPLPFRALIMQPYGGSWDTDMDDLEGWRQRFAMFREEGYNAAVWWMDSEISLGGHHSFLHLEKFPEAREQPPEVIEQNITRLRALFDLAHEYGIRNLMYPGAVMYTRAFAAAHGLDRRLPVGPTVSCMQDDGPDPDGWEPMGVRNEMTVAYTTAAFEEMLDTYPTLDGFYGVMGEALPGKRSTWFREAILPALEASGRNPLFIAHQWQIPIEDYKADIVGSYDHLWLNLHGYNSEQITDNEPYPFVTYWAKETGLPTVVMVCPSNIENFPFNSPRFAAEIADSIKRIPHAQGIVYREWSGRRLSPLFRKALAYYSMHDGPYSDDPWLDLLEETYGSREAARHLLEAYNTSGRIFADLAALVYIPHNNWRFELRLPYEYLTGEYFPFGKLTSPVRGRPLVSIHRYAEQVAKAPEHFLNNDGTDPMWDNPASANQYRQIAMWRSQGGSVYDVIPPDHMAQMLADARAALASAEAALPYVKKNQQEAERARDFMQGYVLLCEYFQAKVDATIAALMYVRNHDEATRDDALQQADRTLELYRTANQFMTEKLNPIIEDYYGRPMKSFSKGLDDLLAEEESDRQRFEQIFGFPGSDQ